MAGLLEQPGLLLFEPPQLGPGEEEAGPVAAHPPDEIAGFLVDGRALEHGAQVRVGSGVEGFSFFVEQRDALALARDAQPRDLRWAHARFAEGGPGGARQQLPAFRRVQLAGRIGRVVGAVVGNRGADHREWCSERGGYRGPDPAGPEIDDQKLRAASLTGHGVSPRLRGSPG